MWRQPSRTLFSLLSPRRTAYGAGTSTIRNPLRAARTIISEANSIPVERKPRLSDADLRHRWILADPIG